MPDAREVYQLHAEQYDALVRCEDRSGNLLPAIQAIAPLAGADVVELGAGSWRLTTLLAPHVRSIRAFDASAPMLEVARRHLTRLGTTNWQLAMADNTRCSSRSTSSLERGSARTTSSHPVPMLNGWWVSSSAKQRFAV